MARGTVVGVTVAALILGLVAVALSFAAYANRIKASDVEFTFGGNCIYPNSSAFAIGIVAAVVLLVEQILVSVGTACFCCRPQGCPSGCSGVSSVILFVISWISFWISFSGLIYTAMLNNSDYLTSTFGLINGDNVCYLGRDNLFVGAAVWCIITIVLGLFSVTLSNAHDNTATRNNNNNNFAAAEQGGAGGVPMAQPYPPMQPNPQMQPKPYGQY